MCGKIMGKKGLNSTGITYVDQWIKEQLYSRRKEFSSKYTQKGNIVEGQSIDFIADQLGYGMLFKNETPFKNEYITGTPDIITNEHIIDAKNSWDFSTFPLLETEIPNDDYYWQGQCYMDITGVSKYKLVYTLTDTPIELIEKECYWYCQNNNIDHDQEIQNEFIKKMTYDDIDPKLKIKVFEFERNDADIKLIYDRVEQCREIIKDKLKDLEA